MERISQLTEMIISFRDDRSWKQFHNPKDMAISLSLEASELLEHFQWKNADEISEYVVSHKDSIADELSDVLYWVLLISHDLDINIVNSLEEKMKRNIEKYPIEKAKGSHKKYTEL